jgi:hypothetical protein
MRIEKEEEFVISIKICNLCHFFKKGKYPGLCIEVINTTFISFMAKDLQQTYRPNPPNKVARRLQLD